MALTDGGLPQQQRLLCGSRARESHEGNDGED